VLLAITLVATAEDGRATQRPPSLPKYQQECASCHVAYPPDMLPAASWQRVMAGLPRHFGTDASLDAASVKEIAAWLDVHAGRSRKAALAPPENRITRTAWFTREHDELPPIVWKRPSVKSPANCGACHQQADQGDFSEHNVRVPR
jgi:nitrate/TMAO reductase-like tetraheme cytochrome c subunit